MSSKFYARWKRFESDLTASWGSDISTPSARRKALFHFHVLDHGMLRALWTNLSEVSPGVWRSNQPSPRHVRRLKKLGIRTIINLRGINNRSPYLFEKEACDAAGIDLVSCSLSARTLVDRKNLLQLLDLFETIERPFSMHCKSGADRAGLAAALYILHIDQGTVEQAQKQLSFRYLHIRSSSTGVLDFMLDAYQRDTAQSPVPIREWIETRYNHVQLNKQFTEMRAKS